MKRTFFPLLIAIVLIFPSCSWFEADNDVPLEKQNFYDLSKMNFGITKAIPESLQEDDEVVSFYKKYYAAADKLSEKIHMKLYHDIDQIKALELEANDISYTKNDMAEAVDLFTDFQNIRKSAGSIIRHSITCARFLMKLTYLESKAEQMVTSFSEQKANEFMSFKWKIDSAIVFVALPEVDIQSKICNAEYLPSILKNDEDISAYFEDYKQHIFQLEEELFAINRHLGLVYINGYLPDRSVHFEKINQYLLEGVEVEKKDYPIKYKKAIRTIGRINDHKAEFTALLAEGQAGWSEEKIAELEGAFECYNNITGTLVSSWLQSESQPRTQGFTSMSGYFDSITLGFMDL